jgi:hypothetical protein
MNRPSRHVSVPLQVLHHLWGILLYAAILIVVTNVLYYAPADTRLYWKKTLEVRELGAKARKVLTGAMPGDSGQPPKRPSHDAPSQDAPSRNVPAPAEGPGPAETPDSSSSRSSTSKGKKKPSSFEEAMAPFDSSIQRAASQNDLDANLLRAIAWAESRGDPQAVSQDQALGLFQIRLPTARDYRPSMRRSELLDPTANAEVAARHLARLKRRVRRQFPEARKSRRQLVRLLAACYNAGEGRVIREYGGVPPFRETRAYVKRVWSTYRRLQRERLASEESAQGRYRGAGTPESKIDSVAGERA